MLARVEINKRAQDLLLPLMISWAVGASAAAYQPDSGAPPWRIHLTVKRRPLWRRHGLRRIREKMQAFPVHDFAAGESVNILS